MVKRLGHAFLRRLLRHAELVTVQSGARVVHEGDMGTEFYVPRDLEGTSTAHLLRSVRSVPLRHEAFPCRSI